MLSGRRLDLLDPSPLDVEVTDIAHGLARVARWNGQTRGAYAFSVAQHSVLVEDIVCALAPDCLPASRLAALLHDAPEYVIGDMISPFKAAMGGDYKEVEQRLQRAVHLRFGLPAEAGARLHALVKRADRIAAFLEATELAGFSQREATEFFGRPQGIAPDRFDLTPRPTEAVQNAFLARFDTIDALRRPAPTSGRNAPAGRETTA
jgi:uncharacterized protein